MSALCPSLASRSSLASQHPRYCLWARWFSRRRSLVTIASNVRHMYPIHYPSMPESIDIDRNSRMDCRMIRLSFIWMLCTITYFFDERNMQNCRRRLLSFGLVRSIAFLRYRVTFIKFDGAPKAPRHSHALFQDVRNNKTSRRIKCMGPQASRPLGIAEAFETTNLFSCWISSSGFSGRCVYHCVI